MSMLDECRTDATKFRDNTRDTLLNCAKYLEKNADRLADKFADGCTSWSIRFSFESSDVPTVKIETNNKNLDIIWYANQQEPEYDEV